MSACILHTLNIERDVQLHSSTTLLTIVFVKGLDKEVLGIRTPLAKKSTIGAYKNRNWGDGVKDQAGQGEIVSPPPSYNGVIHTLGVRSSPYNPYHVDIMCIQSTFLAYQTQL